MDMSGKFSDKSNYIFSMNNVFGHEIGHCS